MKTLSVIGLALALAIPATAHAAARSCEEMACCQDKGELGKDKQTGRSCCGDDKHDPHASHDMPVAPAK